LAEERHPLPAGRIAGLAATPDVHDGLFVAPRAARPRVLFFVEGFTDIRFLVGLSEISELTMCVPARQYNESGLKDRVAASGIRIAVHEIQGGRPAYQMRSLRWLWRRAREFDVILSQEVLRGSLNATLVGAIRQVPVVTTMAVAPIEYFRCRRERGEIGWARAWAVEAVIRALMTVNGYLATRCIALGPYLQEISGRFCSRTESGAYYGVDTSFFRPATGEERTALRIARDLPLDRFLIFLSSRISHEKDPETVLRATALARAKGLDAVLLNLGGGYKDFLALAERLGLPDAARWVIGRPAAHPMTEVADYFRAADVVAQASLAEGLGLSTLESLACGTPVVATAVGGMALALQGLARLTPRRDASAMADALLWIASHREEARAQALQGREMVGRDWSRQKAFGDLADILNDVSAPRRNLANREKRDASAFGTNCKT
jgi:glycosyltransferase involved in cell wall biosynthesis